MVVITNTRIVCYFKNLTIYERTVAFNSKVTTLSVSPKWNTLRVITNFCDMKELGSNHSFFPQMGKQMAASLIVQLKVSGNASPYKNWLMEFCCIWP